MEQQSAHVAEADRGPSLAASCACTPPAASETASATLRPSAAESSASERPLVYALGTVGYDFGSEARRDSFKQLMPAVDFQGTSVPANPYDPRQMAGYLADNPAEAKALIWTVNLEMTPIYAIEPHGAFARDVYAVLVQALSGQIVSETDGDFVERVSVPGRLTNRTTKLYSGQIVPVVEPENTRGFYGWQVNRLTDTAVSAVKLLGGTRDETAVRGALRGFLNRVYFDLRNLGRLSADRAVNFAATNAFQAATAFGDALAGGLELDSIDVEPSPYSRIDSDAWDVKLKFFDPENSRRAKRVFRYTIDVSDVVPVTLGEVRSWATSD